MNRPRAEPHLSVAGLLFAWIVVAAFLVLGAIAVGIAMLVAPALWLAARLLRRSPPVQGGFSGGAVYEGEFRVLDGTGEERS